MKKYANKITIFTEQCKSTCAGALLFAIIMAFVISLLASALVILTTNQYRIIDNEIDRTRAYYRTQAGMEYSIYQAYTNANWLPAASSNITYTGITVPGGNVDIRIQNPDPAGISAYSMNITTNY